MTVTAPMYRTTTTTTTTSTPVNEAEEEERFSTDISSAFECLDSLDSLVDLSFEAGGKIDKYNLLYCSSTNF